MISITVSNAKNAKCDYTTIAAAIEALPENQEEAVISVGQGIYFECLTLSRPNTVIIGEGPDKTIISFNLYARQIMPDGIKRGTFRTQTFFIDADNVTLKNLTIENTAGFGQKFGQAVALYADGDRLTFENVHLLGSQDTLFTAPLPPTEYEPGGFRGPKEHAPRRDGRHLYKDCYICGDVDFIFGGATCWFENCEIFSKKNTSLPDTPSPLWEIYGYVTAASTPEGREFGYVFKNCSFTSDCPKNSVYLGRPWRNYAKTVLISCTLGQHIRTEGWHDWDKTEAHDTMYYAEYLSKGLGAGENRAPYVHLLNDSEASKYTRENVIGF